MNAKAKGTRREHQTIALLESQGYRCTRAAASLGEFDVIAVGTTDVLLVQVKSNRWPRSPEMLALARFQCPPNAKKIIHRWRDGRGEPDIKEVA